MSYECSAASSRKRHDGPKDTRIFCESLAAGNEERKKFAALMRKVEGIRVREGWSKRTLAAELGTPKDALHNWISGRAIGRRASVERIKAFLRA